MGADGGLDKIVLANLVSLDLFESELTADTLTALITCHNLKQLSLRQCGFKADTHDAFKALFGSLTLSTLIVVPSMPRDLTTSVFEAITQQSQLERFEISFFHCPRWQLWAPFIEKNTSLKHFKLVNGRSMGPFMLEKIVPLLPPLETLEGLKLDDTHLRIIAQKSQRTLKTLKCSSDDLFECAALGLCRDLEVLDLSNCHVKDEDLRHVFSCLNGRLLHVNLSQCKNISSETIAVLLQQCPLIRAMNLSGKGKSFTVANRGLNYLPGCVRLNDALLPALEKYGHCLQMLDLRGCPSISTEKVDQLRMFSIVRREVTRNIFGQYFVESDTQIDSKSDPSASCAY